MKVIINYMYVSLQTGRDRKHGGETKKKGNAWSMDDENTNTHTRANKLEHVLYTYIPLGTGVCTV